MLRNTRAPLARTTTEIEQAVVVVVDELRRHRASADSGGASRVAKRPWPSLSAKTPGASAAAEEEIGEAVLVDVAGGDRAVASRLAGSPDVRRRLAERAVAHVPEEQRRALRTDEQQVDVAAVVEVGRDDRRRAAGAAADLRAAA